MEEAAVGRGISRETWIGVAATAIAVGAMAVDHLLGNERDDEDVGFVDPGAFAVSAGLSVATAVLLFRVVVPRARARGPSRAASVGLACSVLGVVLGLGFAWLGFPFVVAGAGVALGLVGLGGDRRRLAFAAVAIGVLALTLGAAEYLSSAVVRLA